MSEKPFPTYPELASRVAVVTGGSKGIGAASCRLLARNGVKVAVVAREQAAVERLVAELHDLGAEASGHSADMLQSEEIDRVRDAVEANFGPADILLPFAGGFLRNTPITEITEAEWRQVIDSNLTTTFLTCRSFLPRMIERRRGVIVTMASNAGRLLDLPLTASYAAAKAGIVMFTRHVAQEVGVHGVRVNSIAPATISTERVERVHDESRRLKIAALSPLGRLGTPDDVALAALYLVSDSAAWLTGVTLDVAGGRVML